MYVSRGMGADPRHVLPLPVFRRRRGMGADGSTAATCTSPNYWNGGLSRCCAPLGTDPGADPCSILNNPGFLAAQNVAVQGDIAALGPNSAAAVLAGVPIDIGDAAVYCSNHPGGQYSDPISGKTFQCPAGGHQDLSGAFWSNYTVQQLAQMLNAQYGAGVPQLPGNAPIGTVFAGGGPSPDLIPTFTGSPTVRLLNSSGGSNSSFAVGDGWQIVVTGPPNAQVTASASQNGTSLGTTPMGTTDSTGRLTLTGTFAQGQVGQWSETWNVGGVMAGSLSFSVAAPSTTFGSAGAGAGSGAGAGAGSGAASLLSGGVTVAGMTIPTWGLIAAGVAAVLFLGGRH